MPIWGARAGLDIVSLHLALSSRSLFMAQVNFVLVLLVDDVLVLSLDPFDS
jgi:hypothetical protein